VLSGEPDTVTTTTKEAANERGEPSVDGPWGLYSIGQSVWLDDLRRDLLDTGSLARYIQEWAVTGLTSNPSIFDAAISGTAMYDEAIAELVVTSTLSGRGLDPESLFLELAVSEVARAADLFAPVFRRTAGVDGWVSIEVSPLLAHDAASTIEQARGLHRKADRPNVFIKIPGTTAGVAAIEEAIFEGIPVNVTLLFSCEQYLAAAEAYLRGLERRAEAGLDVDVRSVASVFVSRWDKAVADKVPESLHNRLGIAVAGLCHAAYRDLMETDRWQRLANLGARPQRLLFASTSTKDPAASDVLYIEALAAPHTVVTMPEHTLQAFADHGAVRSLLSRQADRWVEVLERFSAVGIDLGRLAADLQQQGVRAFTTSWQHLMETTAHKAALTGRRGKHG